MNNHLVPPCLCVLNEALLLVVLRANVLRGRGVRGRVREVALLVNSKTTNIREIKTCLRTKIDPISCQNDPRPMNALLDRRFLDALNGKSFEDTELAVLLWLHLLVFK